MFVLTAFGSYIVMTNICTVINIVIVEAVNQYLGGGGGGELNHFFSGNVLAPC